MLPSYPEWISEPGVDTRSEFQNLNPHTMQAGVDFAPELNIYYYIVPGKPTPGQTHTNRHFSGKFFVLGV